MPETQTRLQLALSDRYRIEREIGAGGMATVFLGQDLRHDRRVALKLLRPELSAVIGAERFLAEIKLTANLQHPHILPLFDSGEVVVDQPEGTQRYLFYVMPFVEGESLRARLNREKQLPVADAVRIALEVASALDYAHRHGVVHRDIKPENILLHDGQALVADFGIALAASKAGGNRMTETGMSLGTPHYMSPEQAMGEREITARSDVYALGVVLYEMLTGDPPFTGSTAQAIVARVLTEPPRPILPQRHTIPPEVEAAILVALEKLPADRFATAAEFADALKGRGTGPTRVSTAAPAAAPAASRRTGLDRMKVGLAAALALALLGAGWGWLRPGPPASVNRFSLYLSPTQALAPANISGNRIAISPDGQRMVYVGPAQTGVQLWLREHDQLSATPVPGTAGAGSPFFSPDGSQLGFLVQGTRLRTVALGGGPTVSLSDSVNSSGGDWATDGNIYIEVDSGIARLPASGGRLELLYNMLAHHESGAEFPVVLPGAKGMLFRTRRPNQAIGDFQIVAMPLPQARGEADAAPRADPRGLRPLLAHGAPAGGDRRGEAGGLPVRPRQAGDHRGAGVAARGDRDRDRRVLDYAPALEQRDAGVHHRRRRPAEAGGVGEPGGPGDAGGLELGAAGDDRGRDRSRPTGPRWPPRSWPTATARSGSNTCRAGRRRGSPSATRPTSGPPGRPTAGRWCTSATPAPTAAR